MTDAVMRLVRPFHFRGKRRLIDRIGAKNGIRSASIFGSTFELNLADGGQRHIYQGTFEPHETRLVRRYLKPGMTFVDVGANVGYYTALAAHLAAAQGRVIAFEPSPYAFERLTRMIAGNGLKQAEAVNAALGDEPGTLDLYSSGDPANHSPSLVSAEDRPVLARVPVRTLDEEAKRLQLERIDFIKIDVEGYEPSVLRGAKRLLAERRIRAILCEFNPWWLEKAGSDPESLERIIYDAGLTDVTEKRPFKGLYDIQNRMFTLRA